MKGDTILRNTILAACAFVVIAVFLGILLWRVPRLDLGIVVTITVAMVLYDFFFYRRKNGNR